MAPRKKETSSEVEELQLSEPTEAPVEAVEPETKAVPKTREKTYTELYFETLGKPIPDSVDIEGVWCHTCQEKIRTGLNGEPICPAMLKICPRHSS